jgi:hypothetical protein
MFIENLNYWVNHLKDNGKIMAHLYDKALAPDVFEEINNLISRGWKILDKEDKMILIQKP